MIHSLLGHPPEAVLPPKRFTVLRKPTKEFTVQLEEHFLPLSMKRGTIYQVSRRRSVYRGKLWREVHFMRRCSLYEEIITLWKEELPRIHSKTSKSTVGKKRPVIEEPRTRFERKHLTLAQVFVPTQKFACRPREKVASVSGKRIPTDVVTRDAVDGEEPR